MEPVNNFYRSKKAEIALKAYKKAKNEPGTDESDIRDLITDLLHLANYRGMKAHAENRMAFRNFLEEITLEEKATRMELIP